LKKRRAARVWDLCSVTLSSLCMLHCLGLPLLTTVLPVVSQYSDSHQLHMGMVLLALPVTVWVVLSELATRRSELFIASASSGICLMLAAVFVPALHSVETALTVVGSALVGGAHFWRWLHYHSPAPCANEDI